jgi:hypothetical protein
LLKGYRLLARPNTPDSPVTIVNTDGQFP